MAFEHIFDLVTGGRWMGPVPRQGCDHASNAPAWTPSPSGPAHCPSPRFRRAGGALAAAVLAAALLGQHCAQGGSILREVWEGIEGSAVADLTASPDYPDHPTSTNFVADFFEAPTDVLESYGQRLHGYVVPPATGDYTFWIASDDGGELWLSSDATPANARLIAWVSGWTSPREWTREANQQSAPVSLQAGKAYYVQALQKEGGGGDNLAVRWIRPGAAGEPSLVDEAPIPVAHLQPWGISFTPPIITEQPTNTTTMEGDYALLAVKVGNPDALDCRWQRSGTDLPDANAYTLHYGPATLSDNGALFRCRLSNALGVTNTTPAVLTVTPDTTKPTLVAVINQGRTGVVLTYSEPVATPGATNLANYDISNGVNISAIAFGADNRTVVLATSSLTYGANYTLTVSGVQDLAASPNTIEPGSQIRFTAVEYLPADVGGPALAGSTVSVPGGVDVTGGGKTIGGTSDQFHFGYQPQSGDFDLQVRVAGVTVPDPFMRAGLMLRESLEANARFGAVFAGSAQYGCFFESRANAGAQAAVAAPAGGYPANYPYTWLRLQRQGPTLTGYASLDARTWTALGAVTLANLPAKVYLGFAVTGDNAAALATARFRDLGPTQSFAAGTVPPTKEPLGPSSRTTGMILSEIMYHSAPRADGRNLEFIELANARSVPEILTGWRLSGAIDFTFPDGFTLPAGEYVVVAAAPDDLKAVYGITNVLGPYQGRLPGSLGTIQLNNNAGAVRWEVSYDSRPPWPAAADGAGPSLVLARPSLGEANPAAWAASEFVGGSPGTMDPTVPDPLRNVVINEFLAHTDPPEVDFIELYNHSNAPVDLSGCWLSDDPATNRFRLPANTLIPARGFVAFTEDQLGFRLNAAGETLVFRNPDLTRVLDALSFIDQENGVASGRSPDGAPTIRRLSDPTPGAANALWRPEDIVINELMYAPLSGDSDDQYVELYNRSSQAVDLGNWQLMQGIEFAFPTNTLLPAGGYLVVAKNAAQLIAKYPHLNAQNTLGNFRKALGGNGDHVVLAKPDHIVSTNTAGQTTTNVLHIAVAEVAYGVGGRWGQWANGGGSSLELIDANADPLRAANWADSDETTKAPWTTVAVTNKLDNGNTSFSPNRFRIALQGAGECLVDDIEVFRDGTVTNLVTNGDFEAGATGWSLLGNHSLSGVDDAGGASGPRCLHVRGQSDGDTGVNGIRTPVKTGLANNNIGVIRAKVRWLRGWPEVLFRLQGNYLELPAQMAVPAHLGTPGLPNSRQVPNAGPAIFDVAHRPVLPRANEAVVVTCRLSDPDGIDTARVRYRIDPSATLQDVTLRDDGTGGDEIAGDGVYAATIPGRAAPTLAAFQIVARDASAGSAPRTFPALAPAQECLIRWGEPIPTGTFSHYHLWSTAATEQARGRSPGLDNTWRDATLVCGNFRVIYNAGFRDKGSPWHQGYGDIVVSVPEDDLLLGTTERNFASTGNGGPEETDIRSQLSAWLAQQLGLPYLHAQYIRFYRNGGLFRTVCEDLEVPNRDYAKRWFPAGGTGDFYKLAMWFEFRDDNITFDNPIHCTIQNFRTTGNAFKLARYRWNWQRRAQDGTANNHTNLFDLVNAANDTSANYVPRLLALADMEEWMRVFAFNRILGNWDDWTYNVGQNMFALKQPGELWKLIPWDIDFTFGLGDGATSPLGGGTLGGNSQDPVANRFYDAPAFRRMLWRAHQDAALGPLLATNYNPQISARRSVLLKNGITDAADPRGIGTFIESRRNYILNQLKNADAKQFAITSNGGSDFASTTPTVSLQGTAPFAVATLEVDGVPYPATWSSATAFRLTLPLTQATNALTLVGKDRWGRPVAGATDTITITYTGAIPRPQDFVVINEIDYNPIEPNASFIELYNRSDSVPFDLSGWRFDGVGYAFPTGSILAPNSYLVLVKDRTSFGKVYGATVSIFDEFPGSLQNNGEHLALVSPGPTPADDVIISDVRYDSRLPWPTQAAGWGASLQLIDPAQGSYRVGNWAATATNDLNRVTPGRANATAQILAPFPPLWINEVQTGNTGAVRDRLGHTGPWLELFNRGTNDLDLSAYYLTDTYTNLTRWQFPAGTVIAAQQFLTVWGDADASESSAGEPHTNFRLSSTNGSLALVRWQGAGPAPAVMDYVDYPALSAGRSYGSFPDGEPRVRQWFQAVTPGGTNNPAWAPVLVTINELMAANTRTLLDPATQQYEDWFELYNGGPEAVDLAGYTLTDSLADPRQFVIPVGTTLPGGGFKLVWADKVPGSNIWGGDLHADFKLAKQGAELGLFAPSGTMVDGFRFGPQTSDISLGRFPDGAEPPLFGLDAPTPGGTNYLAGGNRPPMFTALAVQTVAEGSPLNFTATALDPDAGQQVTYSLGPDAPATATIDPTTGAFAWIPGETDGPATVSVPVRATDSGTPPRTATLPVTVIVKEVNLPPVIQPVPPQTVQAGQPLSVQIQADDPDRPPNLLTFTLKPGAPEGSQVEPTRGVFTWTPSVSLPPGQYWASVQVADHGTPPLDATTVIDITVTEAPRPPVFADIPPQAVDESRTFTFTVTATDPNDPPGPLSYHLDLAPNGAVIDTATGVIGWTPTEAQSPANAIFVVRASKTTPPNLSATTTFSVQVSELNAPPVLTAVSKQSVAFGQTLVVTNTATDPDLPPNALTYRLEPGAPAGMRIEPLSGLLSWTPATNQVPSTNWVTVRVTDDGVPPRSDVRTFTVLAQRGSPWQYASAIGTASSSAIYVYLRTPGEVYVDDLTIVAGSQPGVGTNWVANGGFEQPLAGTWTVSPNHAGSAIDTTVKHSGASSLHVVASQGGTTRASSIFQDITPGLTQGSPYALSFWYLPGTTNTTLEIRLSGFGIDSVTGITAFTNAPPALEPIADAAVTAGETLAFFAVAHDADLPNEDLVFSLAAPVPPGATIDPVSGQFVWPVPLGLPASTHRVTVRVTDTGAPPLSAARAFDVVVQRPPLMWMEADLTADGLPIIRWSAEPGRTYRVEVRNGLSDPDWQTLLEVTATDLVAGFTDRSVPLPAARYYRVRQLP